MSAAIHKAAHRRLHQQDAWVPSQGKPTLRESWGVIMRTVDTLEVDSVMGYKEDIDTLLVFAGLFSAVVTAFAVESYQWLQEDPMDRNNALLLNITMQMKGETPPPFPDFTPDPSSVRINAFWFLSLTLALVDALFGLLCKQWVREHERQTRTQTPGQALALRWLRYQSFEKWHVPAILASLPILLEIALFLFFAGLLDLLWSRSLTNHTPFGISLAAVGLAVIFYIATTILPGLSIIRDISHIHHNFQKLDLRLDPSKIPNLSSLDLICPYKSPQSWLIFRFFSAIYRGAVSALTLGQTNISRLSDWPSLDLNIIQRFSSVDKCPDLYELKGFRWLVEATGNMPSMRPHLRNVLGELPPHLVMPTVFDSWSLPIGKPMWSTEDVESALKSSHRMDDLFGDQSSAQNLGITSQILCFRHFLVTYDDYWAKHDSKGAWLVVAAEDIWKGIRKTKENGRLVKAFFRPEDILISPDTEWRQTMLAFYEKHWDQLNIPYQVKLVARFSQSLLSFLESSDSQIETTLLASKSSLLFFESINSKICSKKRLFKLNYCTQPWMSVLSHIRRIHQLDLFHFATVPGYFAIPPTEFKGLLDKPSVPESVLHSLVDSFERDWGTAHDGQKEELLRLLSEHIDLITSLETSSPPRDEETQRSPVLPTSLPTSSILTPPSTASSASSSPFITSARALAFLTFVNGKLAEDFDLPNLDSAGDTVQEWVNALERLRLFRQLPARYFRRIPKRRDTATGAVMYYYTPGGDTESELDGASVNGSAGPDHGNDVNNIFRMTEHRPSRDDDWQASGSHHRGAGPGNELRMTEMARSAGSGGGGHYDYTDPGRFQPFDGYTRTQSPMSYRSANGHAGEDVGGPGAENTV